MKQPLVTVSIASSCLAPVPVEHAWERLRDFGMADWAAGVDLGGEFIPVKAYMVEPVPGSTVGAHRHIDVGHGVMMERLLSLNDYEHSMSWGVITHPDNANPFPGTYVNSKVNLQVKSVSMGDSTIVFLSSTFSTDASHKELMQATFQRLYDSAVDRIRMYVSRS